MKVNIQPDVRARLKELGIEAVKAKLVSIMRVRSLGQMNTREEDLGDDIIATPRELVDWVSEKEALKARREKRRFFWTMLVAGVAAIAAVVAAYQGLMTIPTTVPTSSSPAH